VRSSCAKPRKVSGVYFTRGLFQVMERVRRPSAGTGFVQWTIGTSRGTIPKSFRSLKYAT
jgi:hypothetical protein